MSQNGNTQNNLAIKKKNLPNQKSGTTFYSNLEFAHISSGGESTIDFNSLIAPPIAVSLEGFSNPQPSELIGASITQNRGNVRLHSSARGDLQRFTQFYITSDSKIVLTYETEENEILTGMINNVIRTTPSILDVKKITFTGTLAEGATDVVIGSEYNINANSSTQLGDIIVYRWKGNETPKLMIRCEGNDINNDGNYIEKLSAIEFKDIGRADGENIAIYSPNCVPTEYQNSFKSDLETLGGQVDIISQYLQDVHNLPTNIFQVAPNQVDLRSFGQKVIDLTGIIFGAVSIPTSFLTKLKAVFGKTLYQRKFLPNDATASGDYGSLTFNNLTVGKTYKAFINFRGVSRTGQSNSPRLRLYSGPNQTGTEYGGTLYDPDTTSSSWTVIWESTVHFVANSTTMYAFINADGSNFLVGDGTVSRTYIVLEELDNHELTTKFN